MRHILFCSCNEGMGRMQPLQSRWSVLSTAALRNLKLLAGSGCLEFQKGNGRKGFLKQPCPTSLAMSNKSPFGTAWHSANIGSWKAGSHTCNPLLLKAQSRQVFIGLQQSQSTTESTITAWAGQGKVWRINCLTMLNKPLRMFRLRLCTVVIFGMFSGQRSTMWNGLSGEPRLCYVTAANQRTLPFWKCQASTRSSKKPELLGWDPPPAPPE